MAMLTSANFTELLLALLSVTMATVSRTLYAASKPDILQYNDTRKSVGTPGKSVSPSTTWTLLYAHSLNAFEKSDLVSGFRGLTCLHGSGGEEGILTGFEGSAGDILNVDLRTGGAVTELDTRAFLTKQWGLPPTQEDIIAGYNNIPLP